MVIDQAAGPMVSAPLRTPSASAPVLAVEGLRIGFRTARGMVHAVNGASFALRAGETLAIVGESGSGKSVTGRAIMGLLPEPAAQVLGGSIVFDGVDLLGLSERELCGYRGCRLAMVFQDPTRSLNPTMRIGAQISEAIRLHEKVSARAAQARAAELLTSVRIAQPDRRAQAYPHQLSGGMRQRVAIAMALSCRPDVLIADEPTTALDVTTQAQILDLLDDLQAEMGMAVVLITHDLSIAMNHTDRIAVMYAGRIVEAAASAELAAEVRMPYTAGLLGSVPRAGRAPHSLLTAIPGSPPDLAQLPSGCPFHPRCPRAQDRCRVEDPAPTGTAAHTWSCHLPLEGDLRHEQ